MSSYNLLRKQVVSEIKKRRLIFFTIMLLSFIYLGINLIFGDIGLLSYLELSKTGDTMARETQRIKVENSQLREQVKSIKEDPFYKEKYAREEFGLAQPGEYIFQFDNEPLGNER